MTDTFSKKDRSRIMSQIKAKNTGPEAKLRKMLSSKGLRYRLHYKIDGRPDIVFVSKKTAVFVDGCYWHKCPKCYRPSNSNKAYWSSKIEGNAKRDKRVNRILKSKGWKVVRIWEHEINNDSNPLKRIMLILG